MDSTNSDERKRIVEISLIAVLVSVLAAFALISWKRGSDRAGCILNIRNVQQAVRAHHGVRGLTLGDPLLFSDIVGPGKYLDSVICPGGGTYRFLGKIPDIGVLAIECSLCDSPENHKPDKYSDW